MAAGNNVGEEPTPKFIRANIFLKLYFVFLHLCPWKLIQTSEDLKLLRNSDLKVCWLTSIVLYYNTLTNIRRLFDAPTCSNLLRLLTSILIEAISNLFFYFDLVYISLMVIVICLSVLITIAIMVIGIILYFCCVRCYQFISNTEPSTIAPLGETTLILPVKLSNNTFSIRNWIDKFKDPDTNQRRLNEAWKVMLALIIAINIFSLWINPFYFIFF